jgi:spore germination protein GerM
VTGRGAHRRAALGTVLLAVVALLAACGVPANDDPHVIAAEQVPEGLLDPQPSTSTSSPTPAVQAVTVYYLVQQEGVARLVGVTWEVSDASWSRDRLLAVLAPPTPEETRAGILTSIPLDTELLDTERTAPGELTIDLSRSLFDIQGQELRNAFAQLVWTATELPEVQRVRFRVDGQEFRAPNEAGIEQPGAVARADYLGLAPA